MSLFGKLDAALIPSNPYFIEAGIYTAEVTKAEIRYNKNKEINQLFIEYTIADEDSEFYDRRAAEFFDLVDPNLTQEMLATLPDEDKKKINRNMSSLKLRLCGNSAVTSQKGLGVDMNDLNSEDWDPTSLIGTKVRLALSNWGESKDRVNIKWANLLED